MIEYLVVLGYTIACLVGASTFIAYTSLKYVKDNWSSLRCNPIYMPLAGQVGTDVGTNFINCITKSFHDYAGITMDGVNAQMSMVGDSLGSIQSSMDNMRGMMGNTRSGFMMVFQMVFGKIANLMATTQYLMIRIKTIMGRLVGVFSAIIYAFSAGKAAGQSAWNGPIGQVVRIL